VDHTPDPPQLTDSLEAERLALSRRIARVLLAIALVALGAWILHRFLAALAWAGVLAIALWPLYRRVASALPGGKSRILAPLLVTLTVGFIFTVPFIYVAIEGASEVRIVVHYLGEAERNGVPVPEWLSAEPPRSGGAPISATPMRLRSCWEGSTRDRSLHRPGSTAPKSFTV
jgi:predicted PurR-regulated permease PerM